MTPPTPQKVPPSGEDKGARRAAMCMVITLVSFLGFCLENVFVALTDHYIDNRNMTLPFLFGYGLGIAAIYGLFGTPTSPRCLKWRMPAQPLFGRVGFYFAVVFLCVSVGECLLGLFVETFLNITWWDYSAIPLHVTKFTSVPTSLGFTIWILFFNQHLFDRLLRLFGNINRKVLVALAVLFMVALSVDFIVSGVKMYMTGDFVRIWRMEW